MGRISINENDLDWGVCVLNDDGGISFVTDYTVHPSVAHWDAGKEACLMTKDDARYIALGLCSHGTIAVVIEIPKFLQLKNEGEKLKSPFERNSKGRSYENV